MKHSICVLLLLASLSATAVSAQTATFTWNGDATNGVNLATIDGQPTNPATGYGGGIQLTNGYMLSLLDLPESLGFPNNGYLDCETVITWGSKVWVIGDGTHAGDSYTITGTTSCPQWNGTTNINVTEYRRMVAHRYCRYSVCKTSLIDTMENGFGTATVE